MTDHNDTDDAGCTETPIANASRPPERREFLYGGELDVAGEADWMGAHTPHSYEAVSRTDCSWMLSRSGEVVLWGEGAINVDFAVMESHGHDPRGYALEIGSRGVPVTEQQGAVDLVTPDGASVGYYIGEVAAKMHPAFSPDVRPRDLHDSHSLDPREVLDE